MFRILLHRGYDYTIKVNLSLHPAVAGLVERVKSVPQEGRRRGAGRDNGDIPLFQFLSSAWMCKTGKAECPLLRPLIMVGKRGRVAGDQEYGTALPDLRIKLRRVGKSEA